MFRYIRYQTGEINEIVSEMRTGNIPCMDVDDTNEMDWFIKQLSLHGIYRAFDIPLDKNARDRVKEPEFEFRAAFYFKYSEKCTVDNKKNSMYIDFYFKPEIEETYDSISEI